MVFRVLFTVMREASIVVGKHSFLTGTLRFVGLFLIVFAFFFLLHAPQPAHAMCAAWYCEQTDISGNCVLYQFAPVCGFYYYDNVSCTSDSDCTNPPKPCLTGSCVADGDGYSYCQYSNDNQETCNGVDDNCDGVVDGILVPTTQIANDVAVNAGAPPFTVCYTFASIGKTKCFSVNTMQNGHSYNTYMKWIPASGGLPASCKFKLDKSGTNFKYKYVSTSTTECQNAKADPNKISVIYATWNLTTPKQLEQTITCGSGNCQGSLAQVCNASAWSPSANTCTPTPSTPCSSLSASSYACGNQYNDSCGTSCGYGTYCSSGTCSGGTCSGGTTHYSCSGAGGLCAVDASGSYTTSNCNNACTVSYACSGSSCVPTTGGSYVNDSTCGGTCSGGGTCSDSDNDGTDQYTQNFNLQGTVTVGSNSYTDFCSDAYTLHEYFCDSTGAVSSTSNYCPNGCSNGACNTCTPNCAGKTCGPDGCGGSCGSCGVCQTCSGGSCQNNADGTVCGPATPCASDSCTNVQTYNDYAYYNNATREQFSPVCQSGVCTSSSSCGPQSQSCTSANECSLSTWQCGGLTTLRCHYTGSSWLWATSLSESGSTMCTDGYDNNCNGQWDYDTLNRGGQGPSPHGDSGCPVAVTGASFANASFCPGENVTLKCTSSVTNVNSILASVNGSSCTFVASSWSGTTASFLCAVPASFSGSLTGKCSVDTTRSYQSGSNRTATLAMGSSCCSVQTTPTNCSATTGCSWVYNSTDPRTPNACDGAKPTQYYSPADPSGICINGPPAYICAAGSCGASCDSGTTLAYGDCAANCTVACWNYYHLNASNLTQCVPYVCTGAVPPNSTLCPGDDVSLSADTTRTLVVNCSLPPGSAPKCEYNCSPGYSNCDGNDQNGCEHLGPCPMVADLYGRVTDSSGSPLDGASVSVAISGAFANLTNYSGGYTIANVSSGNHSVVARMDGYRAQTLNVRFPMAGRVEQNFTLNDGDCSDCADWEDRCSVACSNTKLCNATVPQACEGATVGEWVPNGTANYISCCLGDQTKEALNVTGVNGCMKDLIQFTKVVYYAGQPVTMHVYTWSPCEDSS